MKKFLIAGSIVDTDADKMTFEDVTPVQVNAYINKLDDGEEMELDITSYGGSVTAGLAICNLLKQASANGHKTSAHVIGIAASMASAIACACDELKIDSNAFLMVHNPWTMTMGNANDIRKEADILDKYRDALLAVYRTKFDVSDETIKAMLDAETWILGDQAPMFKIDAEVIPSAEPLRAAAFAKAMPKFMHTPKALKEIIMEKEEQMKEQANNEVKDEVVEQAAEETAAETAVEEPKAEEQTALEQFVEDAVSKAQEQFEQAVQQKEAEPEAKDEMVTKAEADKRVSGMQSTMQSKINALVKDYEAKIVDFTSQLKAKDEELVTVKAEITSLTQKLEDSSKELQATASALEEKSNALAMLNAKVNTPSEQTDWKALKGKAFFDWYKKTH